MNYHWYEILFSGIENVLCRLLEKCLMSNQTSLIEAMSRLLKLTFSNVWMCSLQHKDAHRQSSAPCSPMHNKHQEPKPSFSKHICKFWHPLPLDPPPCASRAVIFPSLCREAPQIQWGLMLAGREAHLLLLLLLPAAQPHWTHRKLQTCNTSRTMLRNICTQICRAVWMERALSMFILKSSNSRHSWIIGFPLGAKRDRFSHVKQPRDERVWKIGVGCMIGEAPSNRCARHTFQWKSWACHESETF